MASSSAYLLYFAVVLVPILIISAADDSGQNSSPNSHSEEDTGVVSESQEPYGRKRELGANDRVGRRSAVSELWSLLASEMSQLQSLIAKRDNGSHANSLERDRRDDSSVCPPGSNEINTVSCPHYDSHGRTVCVDYLSFCDGKNDCPDIGFDEDPSGCMMFNGILNHIEVIQTTIRRYTRDAGIDEFDYPEMLDRS